MSPWCRCCPHTAQFLFIVAGAGNKYQTCLILVATTTKTFAFSTPHTADFRRLLQKLPSPVPKISCVR